MYEVTKNITKTIKSRLSANLFIVQQGSAIRKRKDFIYFFLNFHRAGRVEGSVEGRGPAHDPARFPPMISSVHELPLSTNFLTLN